MSLALLNCGKTIVYDIAEELNENNHDNFIEEPQSNQDSATLNNNLIIYTIDVGQGDATLVLGPEISGQRVSLLIDAGPLDPDAGKIVENLFNDISIAQLDHLILTHYDADHMGGLVTSYQTTSILWENDCTPKSFFPIESIIDLGESDKETDSVKEYTSCLDINKNLLTKGHVKIGDKPHKNIGYTIDLGGGHTAQVIAGNGYVLNLDEQIKDVDTDNEKSIVVLISGPNDFNFLVTGDLPGVKYGNEDALGEAAIAKSLQSQNIDIEILHAGHHGSATSSTADFLAAINPQVSLISTGKNSYGHPNCRAVNDLVKYSELVLQTHKGSSETDCAAEENVLIANGTIEISVQNGIYQLFNYSNSQGSPASLDFKFECSYKNNCKSINGSP